MAPEDVPRLFVEAWNARRADKLAALFTQDAEFVNVVGLWWHNREDIYNAHDYGLRVIFNESRLQLIRTRTRLLSDEIAVVHAKMHLSHQTGHTSAQSPGNRSNIFTFVVIKTAEEWLCTAAHNTDIVPGAETNIISEGNIKPVRYR